MSFGVGAAPTPLDYTGNGVTTEFDAPVGTTAASLRVVQFTDLDVQTVLTVTTDYTYDAATNVVTLNTALPSNYKLFVERVTPLEQTTQFPRLTELPSKALEDRLDAIVRTLIEFRGELDRAVKISLVDTVADLDALIADISTVADFETEVDIVAGISADVTTVAGIDADVTTVAGITANIATVAGISAAVTTVAGIDTDVTTVAGVAADVTTVAGVAADVTTVAGIAADVTAVEGIAADVTTVAGLATEIVAGLGLGIAYDFDTPQATTSGSEFSRTGISANAVAVFIYLKGIGLSGAGNILVQGGDEDGYVTSGYGDIALFSAAATYTDASAIEIVQQAAYDVDVTIQLWRGNAAGTEWRVVVCGSGDSGTFGLAGGGQFTTPKQLDRVRIIPSSSATFDAGVLTVTQLTGVVT